MINIILYQPEIPTNTGNIIRTCYATGSKLHIIKPLSFDLHPKWFKRSSAGRYLSDIEHEIHENYEKFQEKYGNKKIYYITRYGHNIFSDIDYTNKNNDEDIFIMFGRESTGIPKEILRKNLETCIRIPMAINTRSLNLANCVMLISYEIQRQLKYTNLSIYEDIKGKDWLLK